MTSKDYTTPADGSASAGTPMISGTEEPIGGVGHQYNIANAGPIIAIITESGPNISSQGAVESVLLAMSTMGDLVTELEPCKGLDEELRKLLVHADSELSAIAHGRPPSDKEELLRISGGLRKWYEGKRNG